MRDGCKTETRVCMEKNLTSAVGLVLNKKLRACQQGYSDLDNLSTRQLFTAVGTKINVTEKMPGWCACLCADKANGAAEAT